MKLIAGGLIKKVVIADRLAIYVNEVYGNPSAYSGIPLIVATVFFAFQIYCDFSGYSDIAIGSAQCLGVRLMTNFRSPYLSRSIAEFWTRWHISLSTWFRDYVYIPLGGNQVSRRQWYAVVLLTFLISGLWHGANWTFVAWGLLNGFYLTFGRVTADVRERIRKAVGLNQHPTTLRVLQTVTTFALVSTAWVLFRGESFADALYVFTHFLPSSGTKSFVLPEFGTVPMAMSIVLIAGLLSVESLHQRLTITQRLAALPPVLRWSVYYATCMLIVTFGVFEGRRAFIYFQF